MSRAALAYDSDAAKSSAARPGAGVRVSHPGDTFEVEADRVADTVARGGRLFGWSLSGASFDGVYRQAAPPPQSASPGEIAGKVAEALLATSAGKQAVDAATSALTTPAGMVVTGATAIGVVAALGKAKKPLPAQPPAIPLDILHPGLSVKITYEGPVSQPTGASLTLSYTPKSAEKKPARTPAEKMRAENAAMRADQEKFRAGLHVKGAPDPAQAMEDKAFEKWKMDRLMAVGGILKPASAAAATPGAPVAAHTPPRAATPPEKKPEPAPPPKAAASVGEKKEEIPVQRKAEPSGSITTGSAGVDSVLRSGGRPLESATRREMESRIGYDFGGVRLHTDSRAAESAVSLSAQAYTVGSNVVFAPGRYAPHTTEGRRLLAHELTHVVQQTSAPDRAHPALRPAPRHVQRLWGIDLPDAKNWLIGKLHDLKGYSLFCVVIGQDLITGEQVDRNATTLTQGVLNLFDGGPALFEKLKKAAGALETAYNWLVGRVRALKLTEEYFSGLIDKALAAVELLHPIESWERVKNVLSEPWDKLVELASEIASKIMDFIVEAAFAVFPAGRKIFGILKKAGDAFSKIIADPIGFAKNLFAAVQQGFTNFGKNILAHLGRGLKVWIFEELHIKGVTMPTEFTFASILRLILQVLGLTYEQRRPQLVEKLGEPVVYFFETSAKVLDRVRKEGFVAIWKMIKGKAENLFDSVIDGIKKWAIQQIVTRGLAMVAALATPIGDFIEIVTSIYETLNFIIEKAGKLVELVETVVNALSDIVAGNIGSAAQKVEDTLDRTIPLVLRFLAGLLHLSGIGDSIRKIIDDVRKPIDEAIGKVLDLIVQTAMPLWEAGKAAFTAKLASVKEWWTKPKKFRLGRKEHEVDIEGDGKHPQVFVHSDKTPLEHFLKDVKATPKQTRKILGLAAKLGWKQGELQTPAANDAGASIYDQLAFELDHLQAREAYPSRLEPQSVDPALGGGVLADAYVTANHPVGSEPHGKDPVVWTDLGYLRAEKHYVRGHLLSMRLGGPGEWKNMMPLTNKVNGRMNTRVETPLKKSVANTDRAYHYVVTGKYDPKPLPDPDPKLTPSKNARLRANAAEQRLVQISWTVEMAQWDAGAGKLVPDKTAPLVDGDGNAMPAAVAKDSMAPSEA